MDTLTDYTPDDLAELWLTTTVHPLFALLAHEADELATTERMARQTLSLDVAAPQGTMWVCESCMLTDASGELPEDLDSTQPEPWALWDGAPLGATTPGMLSAEHECGWDGDCGRTDECDCEYRSHDTSDCDGCGSRLDGTRFAYTYWQ